MRTIGLMVAAMIATPAHATPQDDLYRFLLRKVVNNPQCPHVAKSNPYCHPLPVKGAAADARNALAYMKQIDALMLPCVAGDGQACLRQAEYTKAVGRLGWCYRPSGDYNNANNVMWTRCDRERAWLLRGQ